MDDRGCLMPKIGSPAKFAVSRADQARASSVFFGLVVITALIVASAAWMGGSLGAMGRRAGDVMDGAARTLGLSVRTVEVVIADPVLRDRVRSAAMIEEGENMFRADPAGIRRRVEAIGDVVNVRVHRMWPDSVVILADPAIPVALWWSGEAWTVVDGLGRVRSDLDARAHSDLIRLAGAGAPQAAPQLFKALTRTQVLGQRVEGAVRRSGSRWTLKLSSGVLVHLPDERIETDRAGTAKKEDEPSRLELALERLETAQVSSGLLNGAFEIVDARALLPEAGERRAPQVFLTPRAERRASRTDIGAG